MSPAEERKLVTVLFADLAGSTELAVRHDPEQLRALLTAYFEEMAQQVRAFGGVVEKYAGDAIMAVFGVPHVHEDDAERAVRAAVAMQESLGLLNPSFEADYGAALELRVGIATGEAVAVTEPNREFMVTGEVPNLAARLQSAGLGIVLCPETFRLVRPLVETEGHPPLALKGFPTPITGQIVRRLRDSATTRGVPGLSSPLVGREPELTRLHRCATELAQGRGQIVSITGEAGIGKSRLKNELRSHPPPRVRWIEGRCQAFTQHSGYAPIVQILRAMFQLTGAEAPPVARTKLRVTLRSLVGEKFDGSHPAVAHLLGIEGEPGKAPPAAMDPRAFQSQLVLALRAIVEGLVSREPLILTIEDLHWADAATIEILTALTELTDFCLHDPGHVPARLGGWVLGLRFHAQRHYSHRPHRAHPGPAPVGRVRASRREPPGAGRLASGHPRPDPRPVGGQSLLRGGDHPILDRAGSPAARGRALGRRRRHEWPRHARDPPRTDRGQNRSATRHRQGDAPAGRGDRAIRRVPGASRPSRGRERARSIPRPSAAGRASARMGPRARATVHLQARAHAGGGLRVDPPRAAPDAPSRGGDIPRARDDYRPRPGAAACASLAEGRRLGEGAHLLRGSRQAGQALFARPEAIAHYWQALALLDRLVPTAERARTHADVMLALETLPGWRRTEGEREDGMRHLERAFQAAFELGDEARMARLEGVIAWNRGDEAGLQRAVRRAEQAGDENVWARTSLYYAGYLGQVARYEESLTYTAQGVAALGRLGQLHDQAYEMATSGRCYSSRAGHLARALDYAMRARALGDGLGDARLKSWRRWRPSPTCTRASGLM
jgi:class 3 adenylate cyclase